MVKQILGTIIENLNWRHRCLNSAKTFHLDCCEINKLTTIEKGVNMLDKRTQTIYENRTLSRSLHFFTVWPPMKGMLMTKFTARSIVKLAPF